MTAQHGAREETDKGANNADHETSSGVEVLNKGSGIHTRLTSSRLQSRMIEGAVQRN